MRGAVRVAKMFTREFMEVPFSDFAFAQTSASLESSAEKNKGHFKQVIRGIHRVHKGIYRNM